MCILNVKYFRKVEGYREVYIFRVENFTQSFTKTYIICVRAKHNRLDNINLKLCMSRIA